MDAANDAKTRTESQASVRPGTIREDGYPTDDLAWRRMRDRLVRLAYRFLWNREDAEDAAQDALIRALQKSGEIRDGGRAWFWLCRVVVHRCHEYGRRKRRRKRHDEKLSYECRTAQVGTYPDPRDSVGFLSDLINELPRRQREVLVLRHVQGMAFDEIADVLGISASTARVHLIAGREALRDLMVKRHPEWKNEAEFDSQL